MKREIINQSYPAIRASEKSIEKTTGDAKSASIFREISKLRNRKAPHGRYHLSKENRPIIRNLHIGPTEGNIEIEKKENEENEENRKWRNRPSTTHVWNNQWKEIKIEIENQKSKAKMVISRNVEATAQIEIGKSVSMKSIRRPSTARNLHEIEAPRPHGYVMEKINSTYLQAEKQKNEIEKIIYTTWNRLTAR